MGGVLLVLAAGLTLAADPKTDPGPLEGTWVAVGIENRAKKLTEADLKESRPTITFSGTRYKVVLGGKTIEEGTFQLDPGKEPATIDLQVESGDSKGKAQRGFYELKGGVLKIWLADAGKDRPKDTKPAAGVELTILKRKKG
jgi:uncharacterized protein (TIGR03067 family)